jgi:hypothetical protein
MDDLRLKTYNACTFYYGIADYLKPVVLFLSKRGLSPEGFTAMIAESGLRYRGALRLAVDDATYALKVLTRNLPRGPFS